MHNNALFYTYDSMVALSDPRWLQGEFSTLVGLLNMVGLQNNVGKTVRMVFRPCQAAGTQLEASYRRRITGDGPSYRDLQKGQKQCRECGEDMAARSVAGHMNTQHWQMVEEIWSWTTSATGEEPWTYHMEFQAKGGPQSCPVEVFLGRAATRTAMRVHFLHRNVRDTVVFLEEVNLPHPR